MSAPLTPEELAAMKALCSAATPGPWEASRISDGAKWSILYIEKRVNGPRFISKNGTRYEDTEFAARARTAMPRLIAEVERLREREGRYRGDLDSLYRQYHALSTALLHAEQALERGDTQEAMRLLGSAQAGEVKPHPVWEDFNGPNARKPETFEDHAAVFSRGETHEEMMSWLWGDILTGLAELGFELTDQGHWYSRKRDWWEETLTKAARREPGTPDLSDEELEQIEAAEEAARKTWQDPSGQSGAVVIGEAFAHIANLLAIVGKFRKVVE